jgi:transcriptional regulator with XRE-family HTH domain
LTLSSLYDIIISKGVMYMNFNDRLMYLMDINNESRTELAKALGIQSGSVANYCNGNRTPNYDILIKIAKHYDVSIDYLLTGEQKEHKRSTEETHIYSMYCKLDDKDKKLIDTMLKTMLRDK